MAFELNGSIHYKESFENALDQIQNRDKIKSDRCRMLNIILNIIDTYKYPYSNYLGQMVNFINERIQTINNNLVFDEFLFDTYSKAM